MPLARIDLAEGKSTDYRRTIGEVVYDAPPEVSKALKDDPGARNCQSDCPRSWTDVRPGATLSSCRRRRRAP
jgi:hypothetical protein